jgi:hypothetical protein
MSKPRSGPKARPAGARKRKRQPKRCTCLFEPPIRMAPDLSGMWIEHERECPLWPRTGIGNVPVGPAPPETSALTPVERRQSKPPPVRRAAKRSSLRAVASPRNASPIESVLSAVEQITERQPRRSGEDRWMALCPARDDRNPSLSIRDARGKVLVHCFAGCSTEAVLDALRLGWHDLFETER